MIAYVVKNVFKKKQQINGIPPSSPEYFYPIESIIKKDTYENRKIFKLRRYLESYLLYHK